MTYIKSLKIHGFKSFAKPTEIVFDKDLSVIVGPNGSGKCVTGDTLVQLSDGSLTRIDELVNDKIGKNAKSIDDEFIAKGDSTKILALNLDTMKSEQRSIEYYVKRKAPPKMIQIRTRSGRTIKTTKYHPLFTLKDGQVKALKAEELKEKLRIAVPRKLEIEPKTKYFFELLDLINEGDRIYVPWNNEFVDILKRLKHKKTWKELAKEIGIPIIAIKGLMDKQAINFTYLVRILRHSSFNNEKIISLIPFIKSDKKKVYKMLWKNSPEFSRFFGYLLAEGRLPPISDQIWFTNGTEEIVEDYKKLIDSLFGISSTVNEYKRDCWDVLAYSIPIRKILEKLGMSVGKTGDKNVTNLFLAHSSNEEISELLNGLYCGDGYVSDRSIEITTKSKNLAKAIENMLLRLGILSYTSTEIKIATNSGFSGEYKTIRVYGVDNLKIFSQNIYLKHREKQKKVESLLYVKSNPNVDLIEANDLIKEAVKELKVNIKKNRKEFPRIDAYCYDQCIPSRIGIRHLIDNLFYKYSQNKSLLLLNQLCDSDILWDEIIELEEFESNEEWVYDLCIEKDHNFIANNFFIHNSNVTEAMCFVLGRLSAKSMRAKKSANLIYTGGKNQKSSDEAKVEMIFDNSLKTFPLEDNEIRIERAVKHDGNSAYKINGKLKTRQEIQELLGYANIDSKGFNIILQEEITQFIEMHPEDRRKIIEEIAGIRIYEERKEKSQNELARTEEKLKEVSIILGQRKAYLKNLEEEKAEALKYKKHEENIRKCEATLIKKNIEEKEKELKDIEKEIESRSEIIDAKEKEMQKINESIEKLKSEIQNINNHIKESAGIHQENLNNEVMELKQQVVSLGVRKENFQSKIEENKKRKEQLDSSIKDYEREIEELKKSKPKKESRISENIEEKKKELDEIEKARAEFYKTKQRYADIKNKLSNKREIVQRINNQSEFFLNQIESLSSKLSELTEDAYGVSKKLEDSKIRYEKSIEDIEISRNKAVEIEKEISKSEIEIIRQQKIKHDISKIDICPLCKTKLTDEHIGHVVEDAERIAEEHETAREKLNENLKKTKQEISALKHESESFSELIKIKEHDISNINSILMQREHLRKLDEDKEGASKELKELEKESERYENLLKKFWNIEERHDDLRIKIQELNDIPEDNKDARLSLQKLELEKTKNEIKRILREQDGIEASLEEISNELDEKDSILKEKEEQSIILKEKFQELYNKKTEVYDGINNSEKEIIRIEGGIRQDEEIANNFKVNRARANADIEIFSSEFKQYEGIELIKGSKEIIQERLKSSQEALARVGNVNMRALEVYEEIKKQYDEVEGKVNKLNEEKQEIISIIAEIDKKKKKTFMKEFDTINEKFKNNFSRLINNKGPAFLTIENEDDPFAAGVDINVRIAKGKYLDISSLSGGERTLAALALIFAIQEHKPHYFYIFDEIDAALDKRNSERLGQLISNSLGKAQYVVISHNDYILSEAKTLYGITMQEGVSKVLSLKI